MEPSSQAPAQPEPSPTDSEGQPNLSVLQDRIPAWLQFPRISAAFAMVLGGLFLLRSYPSYSPIWHTDVWGHLAYGRWIWAHGALPSTEPLMPLAQGMPFVDSAWLSQLIGLWMFQPYGVTGLQFLYAAAITVSAGALMFAVYRASGTGWSALVSVIIFGLVNHQHLQIVRPQLAGLVCFSLLFTSIADGRWRRAYWWAVPLLFALWANLHGSFIVGLVLLGAMCVGRAIDIGWRTRNWRLAVGEGEFRRWLLLTQLAAAAALLNPYGLGLYVEVLSFSGNPNLGDLVDWDPLTIRMRQGQAAAAALVVAIGASRLSPRRIRAREVLLLLGFGLAAMWYSRMLIWWAVVVAYFIPLHLEAVARRLGAVRSEPSPRSGRWTVVTLGLTWICFAYTPFGYTVIHGPPKTGEAVFAQFRESVSDLTPVGAVNYLLQQPPQGQVFNTYEWGDFLLWAGPPDIQVFVNSHAHLVPEEVWEDYMRVAVAGEEWQLTFDRYGVNTVVIDHFAREPLIRDIKIAPGWSVAYEDNVAVVFVRDNPI